MINPFLLLMLFFIVLAAYDSDTKELRKKEIQAEVTKQLKEKEQHNK